MEAAGSRLGAPIYLRIFKRERRLEVWARAEGAETYVPVRSYDICAMSGLLGPKERSGDRQAPEGLYSLRRRQMNPRSRYHLSIDLGYPNAYDRAHRRTGSALMIHGRCVSAGCYAMTDPVIEELWTLIDAALRGGQRALPAHAFPFRMTESAMRGADHWPHRAFWQQLEPAYAAFERTRVPPRVRVRRGRYRVEAVEVRGPGAADH